MFSRLKYNLDMIDHTSKMSLKMSCLRACDNNVPRARELYEFLSSDIMDIPDVEPIVPGTFEKVRQGAEDVVSWISSHKDEIAQGVSFVQSLRKPTASVAPPIPKI